VKYILYVHVLSVITTKTGSIQTAYITLCILLLTPI